MTAAKRSELRSALFNFIASAIAPGCAVDHTREAAWAVDRLVAALMPEGEPAPEPEPVPNEEPSVYDRMLNSEQYILRSMFDRVEHERDAANAEVERLTRQMEKLKERMGAWRKLAQGLNEGDEW